MNSHVLRRLIIFARDLTLWLRLLRLWALRRSIIIHHTKLQLHFQQVSHILDRLIADAEQLEEVGEVEGAELLHQRRFVFFDVNLKLLLLISI